MRLRLQRSRWGLTLIEVLFAVGLFVVVSFALMTVWLTHAHAVDQAQNTLAASSIADGILAQQAGLAFKAKNDAGNTTVIRSMDGVPVNYVYHWEVTVQDTTVDSPDIKNVVVNVSWKEKPGEPDKSLRMVTSVYWQG